ncbi:MAG: hypothetical protein WKF30_11650 [Pyrinomonadaceae bacterium]
MGITRPGAVSATIGTSGVVFAATDHPALDLAGRVHTFCHAVPDRWHVMGVTQAAGLSLRWYRDQFGAHVADGGDAYERLTEEAAHAGGQRRSAVGALPDGRENSALGSVRAGGARRPGGQSRALMWCARYLKAWLLVCATRSLFSRR